MESLARHMAVQMLKSLPAVVILAILTACDDQPDQNRQSAASIEATKPGGGTYTVSIYAPARKLDGTAWDHGFKQRAAPDLYFCITVGGERSCVQRENPNRLGCNDNSSCSIPFIYLKNEKTYFQVLDYDVDDDDLIDQGNCTPPNRCEIGETTLEFTTQ